MRGKYITIIVLGYCSLTKKTLITQRLFISEYCGEYGRYFSNGSLRYFTSKTFKTPLLPHHCQTLCAMSKKACPHQRWGYEMVHGKMQCTFYSTAKKPGYFRNHLYQGGYTTCAWVCFSIRCPFLLIWSCSNASLKIFFSFVENNLLQKSLIHLK